MKLTIATAFIAASTSAPSISASGVVASIIKEENNKGSVRTAAAEKQGVECALADSVTVQKSADVGVLSCSVGEVCVKDSTSTMGGRCKDLVSPKDETALEPQRERELCEKCDGWSACVNSDQSKIGCGSCMGKMACRNLASDVTIGDNSCVGDYACYSAYVNVGDNSCDGYYACYNVGGNDVPSNSCNGDYKCQGDQGGGGGATPTLVTPSPSAAPTATPVTSSPSAAPTVTQLPSAAPTVKVCPLMVAKVKVLSLTGLPIDMREVRVYSSDINVAIGKNATQSSDLNGSRVASKAVDGKWGSWSSTGTDACSSWWELDLGEPLPVEKVIIVNRKCNDEENCSCKLSHAAITLLDDQGNTVSAVTTKDTCGKGWIVRKFPASGANCV